MVSSARLQSRNYEVQSVELESICSRKDCLERQLVILSVTVFTVFANELLGEKDLI